MSELQMPPALRVLVFSTNPQDGHFFEHIIKNCDYASYKGQVYTWQDFFTHISTYREITAIFLEVNYGLKVSSLNILSKLRHHFPGIPVFCYFSDSYLPVIEESMLQQGAAATLQKPLRPKKITDLLYQVWKKQAAPASDEKNGTFSADILRCIQTLKTPLEDSALQEFVQEIDRTIQSLCQTQSGNYRQHALNYMDTLYPAFQEEALQDSLSVVYHKYRRQMENDMQISPEQTLSEFLHDCNYVFNFSQKGLNKERINCAKELIHSFLKEGKTVTLNTIADEMFISPYYLSRSFKRAEGINFIDYLQNSRLEYAKLLLSTSDASIENIAFQCGYNEVNSFRRLFRKKTGMSPNAYRNSLKE